MVGTDKNVQKTTMSFFVLIDFKVTFSLQKIAHCLSTQFDYIESNFTDLEGIKPNPYIFWTKAATVYQCGEIYYASYRQRKGGRTLVCTFC